MGRSSIHGRLWAVLAAAVGTGGSALGQALIHRVGGASASERQGAATAFLGDLNGDGRADFAVGAPGAGGGFGLVRAYSGANAALLWTSQGPNLGSNFGTSLACVGDVDGDGRADLAIGAPLANAAGAAGCGLVRVVSGASGALLFEFRGDAAGDHMGWSVGRAGDVNRDGVPDVLGGAIDDDDGGDSSGTVRVFSGANGATLRTLVGAAPREVLGYSLDGGADLDGDGTPDLVVGGTYFTSSPQGGVVRVYSGATFAVLWASAIAPTRDALGSAVAIIGDLDGDGRSEVLAGARQPSAGGVGYARLYSGATGAVLQHLAAGATQRAFGSAVGAAGDVDFDGLPDFAIGAPESTTGGTSSGVARLYSGATAAMLVEHVGLAGSRLGTSVRGGLDVDGDGGPDLLLGAPTETANLGQTGAAYARRGSNVPPPDSDGDGTPDVLDGCPFDANKIAPGACGCGVPDTDSDADGTPDCVDGCPFDAAKLAPGACGCGVPETDGDGDGTPDCIDGCPSDANKVAPGVCGCGFAETDTDGDGTPDCLDACPTDPAKFAPGFCGCGVPETDADGDGTPDCIDGCPNDPRKLAPGACGCGVPETDTDGDGAPDCVDGCPLNPGLVSPGACGCDGGGDVDADGDGTPDCIDGCPQDPAKTSPGVCGCGVPDLDVDGDGVIDCLDGTEPLTADVLALPYGSSVPQHLTLRAGSEHAGRRFVMLASLHGTEPATFVRGVEVPLVFDRYTKLNLILNKTSAIVPVYGFLDAQGAAQVEIRVDRLRGKAYWTGRTIHHAFVVLDEHCRVAFVSNAVELTIVK